VLTEALGKTPEHARAILRNNREKLRAAPSRHAPLGAGLKGRTKGWLEMSVQMCAACGAAKGWRVGTEAEKLIPCYDENWGDDD
jgi:hypothetical protein